MAADDDERGSAPDPWDEIVAENLGDGAEEVSLRFDEAAADPDPAASGSDDSGEAAGSDPFAAAELSGEEHADADALVEDWLSGEEGDTDATPPALAVFPPDDAAAGSSAIDIGTGSSGIALHGEPQQEEIGSDVFADAGADASTGTDEWPGVETPAGESAEEGAVGGGFPDLAAGTAAAAGAAAGSGVATGIASAKPTRRPSKPAKKKPGALGQLVGVVLGGAMAIPVTLAILIYGLGKDPFGVTKKVPAEVAFLLPEKFRPGFKKPSPTKADDGAAGPSALDNLPSVPAVDELAADAAPAEPPAVADAVADMPPEPEPEPQPAPAVDELAIAAPGLDDLGARPAPAAPAEPPPLDTAGLDEAVGEATALCEALGIADDRASPAYKKLRTRWYRALARVAMELVAVENEAATSGRPLTAAPDNVAALHGTIGRREALMAELAALAPDWLTLEDAKRGSDGVVLPVTFESARKVGPYWTARVSITGRNGTPHDLTVISRSEPIAIAGDRIVVTGVALADGPLDASGEPVIDGTVVWAADLRGGDAGGLPPGF